jgi:hypothetical protein
VIYVDELAPWGALTRGGPSCRLISDSSVGELLDFAMQLGLSQWWLQIRRVQVAHYDLSPRWRARAISAGAVTMDRHAFAAVMRRAWVALEASGG